ncbi:Hsp70 family protein [Methylococcus sp. EFPC2]|uniref:Hsp70 family protein n=1 Tax=Methylococcus sp. EFPC2 TaxID=2812648 RepID=UPI001967BF7A|nr:Hsp70 family protein [Methylococcus sp. EFPC2]QSA98656.1 hsp70 family protein [Methylococcus sp. EFPC2]
MAQDKASRYLVGIDLGTTHTALAYADLARGARTKIEIFDIDQLIAPGEIAARPLLPSVRYHPARGELTEADTRLPWSSADEVDRPVLGLWARELGAKSQGRLVASAKSWLSHTAVDRTAPILPWGAAGDVDKVSPVEASASYLAYLRSAWSARFPDNPLECQEIVVTVPASFDEVARALTLEATRLAGLPDVRLLEEPQAACYDWLWRHRKALGKSLEDVQLILVLDVGGGTTDFSLIEVAAGDDVPKLERVGVGNHLILGGDNIDLALAHRAEQRLLADDKRLSATEMAQLVEQCRKAKEKLLAEDAPAAAPVTLLGAGARLIGGARSVELGRDEVGAWVLDGFFPPANLGDSPDRKRSGVVEFGLPYAADPGVTRHLAAFLSQHGRAGAGSLPDAVLLNGGVFRSPRVARRVLDQLAQWRGSRLKQLKNDRPDLAVAYGAVAYALARHGLAVERIRGGSARSYFLLVDQEAGRPRQGVCLLPRGSEEGQEVLLSERSFALRLGQPVSFHLAATTDETPFRPGEVVDVDDEDYVRLPPLLVALDPVDEGRQDITVRLATTLTEIGTLRIQCVDRDDTDRRWDLEFQLRRPHGPVVETSLHPRLGEAVELIGRVFGKKSKDFDPKMVKGLRGELEKYLGKREDWDTALLRELFGALAEGSAHRRRSDAHERVWLSLAGYCLRPGFGYPLDELRVEQVWTFYGQGIQFVHESQNWAEWWTFWRRIAGGLDAGAQARLFGELAEFIDPDLAKRGNRPALAKKRSYEDMLRLAAVLERLSVADKTRLGGWLLKRLSKAGESAETAWALGRVGARIPFHGSAHEVVAASTAEAWLGALLDMDWKNLSQAAFAAMLVARMSGDRERDISADMRKRVIERLRAIKAPEAWIVGVGELRELEESEARRVFGETLPPGLRLLG